jgi:hypothetical protein
MVQLGNETCGIIEIERRGYVTAGEKAFVNSQVAEDDVTSKIVALCRKIAAHFKVDMQEAYTAMSSLFVPGEIGNLAGRIQEEFSLEVSDVIASMMASEERKKLIQAFCMIMYRIEGDFTANDLSDLDPQLVEALSDFYVQEESRSISKIADALTDEDDEPTPEIELLEKK